MFIREFVRHPVRTGAIAPSSRSLAREMVRGMGLEEARTVVEFGPGLGAFTPEIVARLAPGSQYFAVEQSDTLRLHLSTRFPHLRVFGGSAADLRLFLDRVGVDGVDCIVSGLPWASFGDELQDAILDTTLEVLNDGARFTTFAYLHGLVLPSARAFRDKLQGRFRRVSTSPVVWGNAPPAIVYRCEV
jgi:phospholipid N-methyltransferase